MWTLVLLTGLGENRHSTSTPQHSWYGNTLNEAFLASRRERKQIRHVQVVCFSVNICLIMRIDTTLIKTSLLYTLSSISDVHSLSTYIKSFN